MKKTLTALALIALLPAGAALADSDDCRAPRDQWQTREAAMQLAEKNGWTVRDFEIDDGCYEIEARDNQGREFEVKLDPATLQIVEMDYEDDAHKRRAARNVAPGQNVQQPQDSLPGDGTPPNTQLN